MFTFAVLQFQNRILNEKDEEIFKFAVIYNLDSVEYKKVVQVLEGEVIVNLTTEKYFVSSRALWRLRQNYEQQVFREFEKEILALELEERQDFKNAKCDERIKKMLFEETRKLKEVIC